MFQRQFNLFGEDYCHRALLQHLDRAIFGQPVGDQLLTLERINLFTQAGQAHCFAGGDKGKGQAGFVFGRHLQTQSARSTILNRPPIKKARGTITATMASATLAPCSLTIIIKLAKQGMNRVIVIMPTTA